MGLLKSCFCDPASHPAALPTAAEMRLCDKITIDSGIPGAALMERAGCAVAKCIKEMIQAGSLSNNRIAVLCGPGNNGGDGLVVARLLRKEGYEVSVIISCAERYSDDFIEMLGMLNEYSIYPAPSPKLTNAKVVSGRKELDLLLSESDLIVDAMLGTGQLNAPRGALSDMVESLTNAKSDPSRQPKVVSIDIPTGVNADSGEVYIPAVVADYTIAIQFIKRGLTQYPARTCTRCLIPVNIGILPVAPIMFGLLECGDLPEFPARKGDEHKGNFGRLLVVGGSSLYPGAPLLSALAALRAGAGLVSFVQGSNWITPAPFELMPLKVEGKNGVFDKSDADGLASSLANQSVMVVGPGLGTSDLLAEFLDKILLQAAINKVPLVIDADALNLIADRADRRLPFGTVITPHPGEAARLLGTDTKSIQADRFAAAKALYDLTGAIVVLKGAGTIVYADKANFTTMLGNPYMATAGSGDVLAGIIGGLIAQGMEPLNSARLGVLIHCLAGDMIVAERFAPLIARDLVEAIPHAIAEIQVGHD